MKPSAKLVVNAEMLAKFKAYLDKPGNGCWGSLHIVLDDFNLETDHVEFCIKYAHEKGDLDGYELGLILRQLSQTQRMKIAKTVR